MAFLLDEALGTRLHVEELNARATKPKLPGGMVYEDPRDVPIRGPVAHGPAAHILEEAHRG